MNTKYFPSGVQLPQHSPVAWCQVGKRGCKPLPFVATSHSVMEPVFRSSTLNLTCVPSGENLGTKAYPLTEASFRTLLPSAFARLRSWPVANTKFIPSEE